MTSNFKKLICLSLITGFSLQSPTALAKIEAIAKAKDLVAGLMGKKGKTLKEFQDLKSQLKAQGKEPLTLSNGSLVADTDEALVIIRPPRVEGDLTLRKPVEGSNAQLKHPKENDHLLKPIVKREIDRYGKETIREVSGFADNRRILDRSAENGDLLKVELKRPNQEFSLTNDGQGSVEISYKENKMDYPGLPTHSRVRQLAGEAKIQIPQGSRIESYDLEPGGKVRLHLKNKSGSVEQMDVQIAGDLKTLPSPAKAISELPAVDAVK